MIVLITLLIAAVLQLFLPWWSIAIASALPALIIHQSGWKSFQNGFLGIAILWILWAGAIYVQGGDILANRIAALFSLPAGWLTILVTGFVGGLAGALSAWTANRFRAWFHPSA
jgi:hypothetical protein